METLEEHIGANIKALRGGMTMQAFGQALRPYLGREWSRQAVWDAENGRRSFTAAELLALAQVLEVTVPQLFESSESLRWPSGRPLEPEEIDGLVSGSNSDRDRWMAVIGEARGLTEYQKRIQDLTHIHSAQIERLLAAARGVAPRDRGNQFDPETLLGPVLNFADKRAAEVAAEWAKGPRGGVLPPLDEAEEIE